MLKRSGRKLFLATNSLWDYTHVVMNYLCRSGELNFACGGLYGLWFELGSELGYSGFRLHVVMNYLCRGGQLELGVDIGESVFRVQGST
jgi:hypothetical protein